MISCRRGPVIMWCINIHLYILKLHNKHNKSLDIYFKSLHHKFKKENNSMLKRTWNTHPCFQRGNLQWVIKLIFAIKNIGDFWKDRWSLWFPRYFCAIRTKYPNSLGMQRVLLIWIQNWYILYALSPSVSPHPLVQMPMNT